MKFTGALTGLLLAAALAGCGGNDDADSRADDGASGTPTAEETPVVEKDARYGTVEDLMEAAVQAGYECKRWKQTDKVLNAAESGSCSGADVFATYASDYFMEQQLNMEREISDMLKDEGIPPTPVLVGTNWTIKTDNPEELVGVLGGIVNRDG